MRFFFAYPETAGLDGDLLESGAVDEVARAAERAGFDGMSFTEHPIPGARWLAGGGHQTLDPFVALGFAAAATTRLLLLTHLSVGPYRNPFLLAKAAATVDRLSGGRFVLGLGAGYQKSEFYALGVDFDERNALFDELLAVLPLHWRGEPFSFHGRHFDARDVIARPRPTQNPIPIWIGGNARRSRLRAADHAQGWMPMPGGPELSTTARTAGIAGAAMLARLITEVQDRAATQGRGPVEIAWMYPDPSLGTDPGVEADRHHAAIAELERIGVTSLFVSTPRGSAEATLGFLDVFGGEYLR
ncbi:LLM class F420-dependent oxidoreductase [Pseudofrankia inefficax]|uniref:Putative F420-dependent oxidoreductase n=1 Tax=Pseudofrankia inefficax (strain DSM 45817 / CECT 9037 / DDB 130130 / EuI1c) TaxID=298654 RepID=E3J7Q8_PSEI1|nr:LLM class F420-dependent oxidoreductase [Pseudofrankia inefficax]ADP80812.1 putative F420-dependent oxidoreductase [Pseudofrankia inefficax]